MTRSRALSVHIFLVCLFCLAAPRFAAAQDWQPVSPSDLAMKDNPADPGTDAMILYRENTIDSRQASYSGDSDEEYIRVKIFTQAGTKEGHVEIPFEKGYLEVKDLEGRTIKPDGTIVKFNGEVLETTAAKYANTKYLVKTLTLPDVTPGCIIEYRYRLQGQPHYVHGETWNISSPMFIREAHFRFRPTTSDYAPTPYYRTFRLPKDAVVKHAADGTLTMDIENVPALVEEPLMPPKASLETRIDFYYQSASVQEAPVAYWNRMAKQWNGEINHFIDKKNALSAQLTKLFDPADSPETKVRKIYARVLQVRNLSYEDYKTSKELKTENLKDNNNVEDVLNRDAAYGRQLDFLMVGLARAAGFEAAEVYLAPRSGDVFSPASEDASELTADVVWVRAGGKEYYLDPGAHYYPFGVLPWFETDAAGIRITDHGAEAVGTPTPSSSDATRLRNVDLSVAADGSISGTLQLEYRGGWAALIRTENRKEDETGRNKNLEDEIKDLLPTGSTFTISKLEDWDDVEKPIRLTGSFKISSFASAAAQHLLVPREVFQPSQSALFAPEKRVNAVYFEYPYEEIDDLTFHAPAGYSFQAVPQDQKKDLGAVLYEISGSQQNGTAEVKRHLAVKGEIFDKQVYSNLRAFFGVVKTYDASQIVLQNAPSTRTN